MRFNRTASSRSNVSSKPSTRSGAIFVTGRCAVRSLICTFGLIVSILLVSPEGVSTWRFGGGGCHPSSKPPPRPKTHIRDARNGSCKRCRLFSNPSGMQRSLESIPGFRRLFSPETWWSTCSETWWTHFKHQSSGCLRSREAIL